MKTIKLFYRDSATNSDKVYFAQVVDVDGGGKAYRVEFQFGKRGAKLAEGTKTRVPVSLAEAEKIFAALVREKTAKGYTEETSGVPFGGDAAKLAEVLPHPRKHLVTLAEARGWSPVDYLIQRKYDGELSTRRVGNAVLLGELVRAKSGAFLTNDDRQRIERHGSFFAAFTLLELNGRNMLTESTRTRWNELCATLCREPRDGALVIADVIAPEIIEACMMSGNFEGVCAHGWGDTWGSMLCHKVESIYVCRVTATGGTQSAQICDAVTGEARGACKFGGGAIDRIRVGSVVRIAGMGLTYSGKIRQPVLCREWLVNQ